MGTTKINMQQLREMHTAAPWEGAQNRSQVFGRVQTIRHLLVANQNPFQFGYRTSASLRDKTNTKFD